MCFSWPRSWSFSLCTIQLLPTSISCRRQSRVLHMQRIAHSLITLAKGNFGLVTVPTSSLRCGLAFLCSLTRDQVDSDGSFGRPTFVMKIPLSPLLLRRHELYVWLLLILVAALVRVLIFSFLWNGVL